MFRLLQRGWTVFISMWNLNVRLCEFYEFHFQILLNYKAFMNNVTDFCCWQMILRFRIWRTVLWLNRKRKMSWVGKSKNWRRNVSQTKRKCWTDDGCGSVCAKPRCNAHRLFSTTIPLSGYDAEKRKTAGFEETKEETGSKQARVIMACSHWSLGDTPSEQKSWHENPMWHFDNENWREWLPC